VAKRVTHPNVLPDLRFVFATKRRKKASPICLWSAWNFSPGKNLEQLLKEKGKLSAAEALPLVKQMVAGLAAAHQAGVVHRDFKTNKRNARSASIWFGICTRCSQ